MKSNRTKPFEIFMMILLGAPVLGILFGGIYSLPAMRITKQRDPWLTILLICGLAITIFAIGLPTHTQPLYLVILWLVSIVLLLLRRAAYGNLGHNLERFGLVHATTLLLTVVVIVLLQHGKKLHS